LTYIPQRPTFSADSNPLNQFFAGNYNVNQNPVQALPDRLKVLILNNIIIFPMLAVTITAKNHDDIELLRHCEQNHDLVAIANPRPGSSIPTTSDNLFPIGTACRVSGIRTDENSRFEAVLEGVCRISSRKIAPILLTAPPRCLWKAL